MLHFEAHKNLKDVVKGECNRLVVYSELGEPVAFVIQIKPGVYITSNIGNSDFEGLLKAFSVDKLVIK